LGKKQDSLISVDDIVC